MPIKIIRINLISVWFVLFNVTMGFYYFKLITISLLYDGLILIQYSRNHFVKSFME